MGGFRFICTFICTLLRATDLGQVDGLVKLLDFGLAKTSEGAGAVDASKVDTEVPTQFKTAPGVVMGTVAYMSPEQARGGVVDERTDIWSLGVVLYEMIPGNPPFMGACSNEIISAILSRQPAPPPARSSQLVPDRLCEIVEKALAKNRDERYQTCKDLLIDLRRVKQSLERGSSTSAPHHLPPYRRLQALPKFAELQALNTSLIRLEATSEVSL